MCVTNFSIRHMSHTFESTIYIHLAPFSFPLLYIFYTASMYCVLGIAMERFLSIAKNKCTNQGAFFGYILPILVFCSIYNIPRFFELRLVEENGVSRLAPTSMMRSDQYRCFLISANLFLTGVGPILCMCVLNCLVSRRLKGKGSQVTSRDKSASFLISGLVLVMVICHAPRNLLNIYELILKVYPKLSPPARWMSDVNHIFLVLSSSCNLLIFLTQDNVFRSLLLHKLGIYLYDRVPAVENTTKELTKIDPECALEAELKSKLNLLKINSTAE
ncbi:uncharacterized protein LOC111704648 [Eurytemora carolleeae]|uniref:uncharacterized protein LOC111704648 n=1 Tax=Eurytemora carolleeae TaxID=1294199 RepID=UPI000C77F422|nr:uncharacterized protein LOC111704648 [Eurytemora carolleeae]|eukprot:XP_023332713.1 uncharacterized protein LOC111704648 [Eurytemora affinis]